MESHAQTTVTICVAPLDEAKARLAAAFRGEPHQGCSINFVSRDLALQVLAPPRWVIVRAMVGHGPMSPEEIGRRVG
ncbi:hypothetical protein FFK22_007930 [Mycobacterium sp. KBS0706]|uniref:hypothetical protein n=1 Tax=Mycobacterium sp. KBS0706 TaxID=2578109 RepID=UPI00110F7221|nr:hypothetical protein [Mycobacterium sp. KBS0706]TSD89170.1 hypothetical protein FFK22_007930 [Mycobacterium sp. KBS0706]